MKYKIYALVLLMTSQMGVGMETPSTQSQWPWQKFMSWWRSSPTKPTTPETATCLPAPAPQDTDEAAKSWASHLVPNLTTRQKLALFATILTVGGIAYKSGMLDNSSQQASYFYDIMKEYMGKGLLNASFFFSWLEHKFDWLLHPERKHWS